MSTASHTTMSTPTLLQDSTLAWRPYTIVEYTDYAPRIAIKNRFAVY